MQQRQTSQAPDRPTGPPSGLTVVVTRPTQAAQHWLSALAQAGHRSVHVPLMAFGPPPCEAAVTAFFAQLHTFHTLVFVSPQAAEAFWRLFLMKNQSLSIDGKALIATFFDKPKDGSLAHLRCWAPGPGTAQSLRGWGVPLRCIDQPAADAPQFDSQALWAVVRHQVKPGHRVLLVQGNSPGNDNPTGVGREWLDAQFKRAGATVAHCMAYTRVAPVWTTAERVQALSAQGPAHVWLLTSSEALGHLAHGLPLHEWGTTTALATHPRIANAATALGFHTVWQSRPTVSDVLQTLAQQVNGFDKGKQGEQPKMPDRP